MKGAYSNTVKDFLNLPLILVFSVYLAIQGLLESWPMIITDIARFIGIGFLSWYLIRLLFGLVDIFLHLPSIAQANKALIDLFRTILRIILLIIILIWFLGQFGVDVTAFIAGFGVLGLAVAFGLQNVIADFFASLTIYVDKPFEVGDIIKVGTDTGKIIKIGMRSTQIQVLTGNVLIISNRELSSARIHNMKRLKRRRHAFTLGVACDTAINKLELIPSIIEEIIDRSEKFQYVTFERAHLVNLGAYSFDYEIVYFIETSDYATYLGINQQVYLDILQKFHDEDIKIPYPTSVVLQKDY